MTDRGFEILQQRYPWPSERPRVEPSQHGWVNKEKQGYIRFQIRHEPKYILELGAWLGQSTRFFLDAFPQAKVVTIDTWEGSPEHQNPKRRDAHILQPLLPVLKETFTTNCWEYRKRLVGIRGKTTRGLEVAQKAKFKPDLIFVDAGHDYDSVLSDLEKSYELWPDAVLVGDDWRWINPETKTSSVKEAVMDFKKGKKLILTTVGHSSWGLRSLDCFMSG